MRVIRLYSADRWLAERIATELSPEESILVCGKPSRTTWQPFAHEADLVVVDSRDGPATVALEELSRTPASAAETARCVVLHSDDSGATLEIVGYCGRRATYILLADCKQVGLLIRTIMNDASGVLAGAVATLTLSAALPAECQTLLNVTIGSGFIAGSVKECAACLGRDRGTLGRGLKHLPKVRMTAGDVVDLVKATYAVAAILTNGQSCASIARAVRFRRNDSLRDLLMRVFGLTPEHLTSLAPGVNVERQLRQLLTVWTERRAYRPH